MAVVAAVVAAAGAVEEELKFQGKTRNQTCTGCALVGRAGYKSMTNSIPALPNLNDININTLNFSPGNVSR